MKFLLLFFIFMVLLWQWRHARQPRVNEATRKNAPPVKAVNMVQCAHCGVHLPASEAIQGTKAIYCCQAHARARER
jgi:uncharacterized protein